MAFRLGSDHEGTKPTMTMAVRVPTRLSRPSMRARAEASEGKSLSIRAKRFVRPLTAAALAVVLSLHPVDAAIAARSSGRMGGNAFHASSIQRSPSSSGKESMRRSRVSPSTTFGWGFFPLVPVTPFGFGYGYGYGYGGGGGGGLFTLLVLGMIAYVAYEAMQGGMIDNGLDDRITVARVQIGLLGLARELQADLDRIAARADTSTAVGLKFVLEETVLALMRNPEYMVYGGSATMVVRGPEEAEDYFNTFSMQERGKFTRETLVNVGGRKKGESGVLQGASISNEYIVVTILVAADGKFKLPRCTNLEETKEALTKVGSLRTGSLQAVEVLWQPQEAGDTLTREELVRDYPAMNTL